MDKDKTSAINFLTDIGSLAQIQANAKDITMDMPLIFNSHIHLPPNYSAFETVGQLIDLAAKQGVNVLGAGNYYDFSAYRCFSALCQQNGIFPLFSTEIIAMDHELLGQGIRINDPTNPGKNYICGKGITRFETLSEKAGKLLALIRRNDAERMRRMVKKICKLFIACNVETNLDSAEIIKQVAKRHQCGADTITLQERHLARAFQQELFEKIAVDRRIDKLTEIFGVKSAANPDDAIAIQNEIRFNLMKVGKACFVDETFVSVAQAKELIAELGGIECYPVIADYAKPICEYETPVGNLIQNLKNGQYPMVEFITVRNEPDVLAEYVMAIRKAGIVVVAGTEHNTPEMLPIKPACIGNRPIPVEVWNILVEGVCVLVGHQFLTANKQSGFGEEYNNPGNDKEEVIKYFHRTGLAVLKNYFQSA